MFYNNSKLNDRKIVQEFVYNLIKKYFIIIPVKKQIKNNEIFLALGNE